MAVSPERSREDSHETLLLHSHSGPGLLTGGGQPTSENYTCTVLLWSPFIPWVLTDLTVNTTP
jgi:hypothetical protein